MKSRTNEHVVFEYCRTVSASIRRRTLTFRGLYCTNKCRTSLL